MAEMEEGERAAAPLATETPNQARLKALAEKIGGIQTSVAEQRRSREVFLSQKVAALDGKLARVQRAEESKVEVLRAQVADLRDVVEKEKLAHEALDLRKQKELNLVQENFATELTLHREARVEAEDRIAKLIEEKFNSMSEEIEHQTKLREQSSRELSQSLSDEIHHCQRKMDGEMSESTDALLRHEKAATAELKDLRAMMHAEVQAREAGEATLTSAMEEAFQRIQALLQAERQEREATQELLLKLMEETCLSVERHVTT